MEATLEAASDTADTREEGGGLRFDGRAGAQCLGVGRRIGPSRVVTCRVVSVSSPGGGWRRGASSRQKTLVSSASVSIDDCNWRRNWKVVSTGIGLSTCRTSRTGGRSEMSAQKKGRECLGGRWQRSSNRTLFTTDGWTRPQVRWLLWCTYRLHAVLASNSQPLVSTPRYLRER